MKSLQTGHSGGTRTAESGEWHQNDPREKLQCLGPWKKQISSQPLLSSVGTATKNEHIWKLDIFSLLHPTLIWLETLKKVQLRDVRVNHWPRHQRTERDLLVFSPRAAISTCSPSCSPLSISDTQYAAHPCSTGSFLTRLSPSFARSTSSWQNRGKRNRIHKTKKGLMGKWGIKWRGGSEEINY